MKTMMMLGVAAIVSAAVVNAEALSLADARAQIDPVVKDPAKTGEVVSQLDAADQVAFLSELNAAIEALPGSAEEKVAKYVDVNESALKASKKGNLQAMLAETFATVPPEALTLVNERLAADLFSRSADPTVTDEEFKNKAVDTMKIIQDRCAKADDSAVRDTFAVLMFLRASNGQPADLRDTLVANLPDESTRELAKNEWIPPAMGEGQDKTYDPMLGASDAGEAPNEVLVLRMASPSILTAMLGDLGSTKTTLTDSYFSLDYLGLPEMTEEYGMGRTPVTADPTSKAFGGYRRGEPFGYQLQTY
ncbi:MAG: hypothetical protein E7049_01755 [Lentisphaerae bacterium]|jgi:hypothetical protein|nr:hypothetical protein [Lentisphaerota bacterium]